MYNNNIGYNNYEQDYKQDYKQDNHSLYYGENLLVNKLEELQKSINSLSENIKELEHKIGSDQSTDVPTYLQLEITSSSRNRKMYPNPCEFVVSFTQAGTNAFNSQDPVSLGLPTIAGVTQAGSTNDYIILSSNSSSYDNSYHGMILYINGTYHTIINYIASNQQAYISPPISVAPGPLVPYFIKVEPPIFNGILVSTPSTNRCVLPANASTVNNFYRGMWIYIFTGPVEGEYKLIEYYEASTNTVFTAEQFTVPPGSVQFEIDAFSFDNVVPLLTIGTTTINQPVCYVLTLTQLTIPDVSVNSTLGGSIRDYPFFYVSFYNYQNDNYAFMYGNARDIKGVTFRIPLDSIDVGNGFLSFRSLNSTVPISMKFNPNKPYYFKISLPTNPSQPITFYQSDLLSPLPPNPLLQISASFSLRRMNVHIP